MIVSQQQQNNTMWFFVFGVDFLDEKRLDQFVRETVQYAQHIERFIRKDYDPTFSLTAKLFLDEEGLALRLFGASRKNVVQAVEAETKKLILDGFFSYTTEFQIDYSGQSVAEWLQVEQNLVDKLDLVLNLEAEILVRQTEQQNQ